jgi:predicted aminopeptidase
MRARLGLVLCAALASGGAGCSSMSYLAQAAAGQDDLLTRSQPMDRLLREDRLPPRTRRLLEEIPNVKKYGEAHGLRPTNNYTKYARLDRDAAVWIVSACEPLRFRSYSWSFPIVGTITYLGWFHLDDAKRAAEDLRVKGWDADLRPAGAYSTAGWFDDPLLSTMIVRGDEARGDLVNTVFHESTHATFFVAGQSRLNESVANFVGDRLAEKYMKDVAGEGAKETIAYLAGEERGRRRETKMHAAYAALEALYASDLPRDEKLADKARILRQLEKDLGAKRTLTNASLVQFKTYHSGEEELAGLLVACGGDVKRLVALLGAWQHERFGTDQEDPATMLRPLLAKGCGG